MSITNVLAAGSHDVLVELADLESVLALDAYLQAQPLPGQRDILAAAQTVMVKFETTEQARAAARHLPQLKLNTAAVASGKLVTIEVCYDGEDLDTVAQLTGLSTQAVVNAHTGQQWRAAFGGFAPGFAYLLGENNVLEVPRRETPRTAVPTGSVALAGEYSAVYPRRSPGGWQLLGHTDSALWDLDREDPALIRPQDRVQFVASRNALNVHTQTPTTEVANTPSGDGLEVLDSGLQSLLQDAGRYGFGALGVPASGAADASSLYQANRLVGNIPNQACIENLTGRISLRAHGDQVLAVSGAEAKLSITPAPEDFVRTEREASMDAPFALLDGERLDLEPTGNGLRSYIAVRGTIQLPKILGSLATDTLSGVGPAPLTAGTFLPIAQPENLQIVGESEPSTLPVEDIEGCFVLRVSVGPRDDWFGPAGVEKLLNQQWLVTSESNRIGVRLGVEGEASALERVRTGELSSEGVALGSLQVPPSGLPVLFLADHPVTGGYPVIATVIAEDLSDAAQLPPGSHIRFEFSESAPRTEGTQA
ncbi:carboxyltransferase domain-containing protein [Glutamicibacter sp.]|jgi:Allophanate hydrolase subunit 2|uniref:5-oxoprolinase subunit B/C family protein n=1 Tax=Glutamicibacter sp. TaxID=1931995 RepID=UPI002B463EE4|nr:carboxyltransferase domain-containing protein [Glutamicibacter sp.]HJX76887.1 carboxyltransferase domain-containing protein [Glutamicibacter sp.]